MRLLEFLKSLFGRRSGGSTGGNAGAMDDYNPDEVVRVGGIDIDFQGERYRFRVYNSNKTFRVMLKEHVIKPSLFPGQEGLCRHTLDSEHIDPCEASAHVYCDLYSIKDAVRESIAEHNKKFHSKRTAALKVVK